MRNEFFGDDRDLFKWSHVLDLAEPDCQVIYIPMSRPDDRRKRKGGSIREDVRQFFREGRMESISNIMPDRILVPSWQRYEDSSRAAYFEKVRTTLIEGEPNRRRVIFVDPDTGMQPKNPNSKHIRDSSIEAIWHWMRNGDVLVIYQHAPQDRRNDWVAAKAEQFCKVLRLPLTEVKYRPELDVCFYWSMKQPAFSAAAGSAT